MNNAIITLNFGYEDNFYYKFLKDHIVPTIKDYANRIDTDFICMDKKPEKYNGTWNQLQFLEYFDIYDNIMYIDGDCFIPNNYNLNVFDIYDKNYIYCEKLTHTKNICHNIFSYCVMNKKYRKYFMIPKLKYQLNCEYICKFNVSHCNLEREECFFNQTIVINNIPILYNLIDFSPSFKDTNKIVHFNSDGKIANSDIIRKIKHKKHINRKQLDSIVNYFMYKKSIKDVIMYYNLYKKELENDTIILS